MKEERFIFVLLLFFSEVNLMWKLLPVVTAIVVSVFNHQGELSDQSALWRESFVRVAFCDVRD